jgi:uncharacterized protein DUF3300
MQPRPQRGGTVGAMKALVRFLLACFVGFAAVNAHAQRAFEPSELEALLAPVALYPDPLLSQILDASQYPQDVAAAAAWMGANPQLSGDAALATVQGTAWAASVKSLVASPEVLARMAESPQWLQDLAEAYRTYGPNVMATVQELRARAQASGYLQSNDQQYVTQQGEAIVVQPASPNVVYAPYYDPYVVYGGFAWTAYRPVFWRPWVSRPRFVTHIVVAPPVRWYVHRYPRPAMVVHAPVVVHRAPAVHGGPTIRPYRAVPESQRAPIIHSGGPAFVRSAPAFAHRETTVRGHARPLPRGHAGHSARR